MARLGLPDAWLVAGCLFQAVWNAQDGRDPAAGINDYDLFYFDALDLSYEAEDAVIRRADGLFADLGAQVEIRNQARVHLWYPERFGADYLALTSSRDGIDRFLVAGTCIGVRPMADGRHEIYAPYGLGDIFEGLLRPNPANLNPVLFARKAESYRARWPWLRVVGDAMP
ncbi:MAG: nucleotidyltransferase family protein [Alphaproteobacteria bacterium]|nr:nucleotidyltransferase family protein [Alphaproteobacteria bacterium]